MEEGFREQVEEGVREQVEEEVEQGAKEEVGEEKQWGTHVEDDLLSELVKPMQSCISQQVFKYFIRFAFQYFVKVIHDNVYWV